LVCNPTTREVARLPLPEDLDLGNSTGFYLHTPTAEYRVLFYYINIQQGEYEYFVAAPGQHRARKINPSGLRTPGDDTEPTLNCAPVILRGCLHWMMRYSRPSMGVVVFDTISEKFRRMRGPLDGDARMGAHTVGAVVGVDGALGASLFVEGFVKVWILVNYEEETWTLRYSVDVSLLGRSALQCFVIIAHVSDEGDALLMTLDGGWCGVYNLRRGHVVKTRLESFPGSFQWTSHVYKESLVSLLPKCVGAPNSTTVTMN
jgi:F-box interacting protein